ncbi:MAG: hypothetical protein SFU83_05080 [Meiothermus sp.]|nr:hypothetical protein [Meiothermus sp.]
MEERVFSDHDWEALLDWLLPERDYYVGRGAYDGMIPVDRLTRIVLSQSGAEHLTEFLEPARMQQLKLYSGGSPGAYRRNLARLAAKRLEGEEVPPGPVARHRAALAAREPALAEAWDRLNPGMRWLWAAAGERPDYRRPTEPDDRATDWQERLLRALDPETPHEQLEALVKDRLGLIHGIAKARLALKDLLDPPPPCPVALVNVWPATDGGRTWVLDPTLTQEDWLQTLCDLGRQVEAGELTPEEADRYCLALPEGWVEQRLDELAEECEEELPEEPNARSGLLWRLAHLLPANAGIDESPDVWGVLMGAAKRPEAVLSAPIHWAFTEQELEDWLQAAGRPCDLTPDELSQVLLPPCYPEDPEFEVGDLDHFIGGAVGVYFPPHYEFPVPVVVSQPGCPLPGVQMLGHLLGAFRAGHYSIL